MGEYHSVVLILFKVSKVGQTVVDCTSPGLKKGQKTHEWRVRKDHGQGVSEETR